MSITFDYDCDEITPRQMTEKYECETLSPFAVKVIDTKGRRTKENKFDIRTDFARDRDRIIHCNSFRRLKHKTQVFLSPKGDHYRTRLTHTLEVSQIARTISRALRLNEDLTEAIALGHDLGHTPFGHAGESILKEITPYNFRHNLQSIRVVEYLERNGKGLNLTYEVKNGIATHSAGTTSATTLEGRVVEISDKIAYINHDIEDAIRASVLSENDLPYDSIYVLGRSKSQRIDTIIKSIITHSMNKNDITMDKDVYGAHINLRKFMFDNVYVGGSHKVEEKKAQNILQTLYEYFIKNPSKIPQNYQFIVKNEGIERASCDLIASMTDNFAINIYKEIYIPNMFVNF